ncbi:hypothetical protein DFJ73DRAFT_918199 [Zopfochytrium polystomum]|nr:hypothetical protein DFJ73DRAFT_918199 [Zopfochytrium polystomum]
MCDYELKKGARKGQVCERTSVWSKVEGWEGKVWETQGEEKGGKSGDGKVANGDKDDGDEFCEVERRVWKRAPKEKAKEKEKENKNELRIHHEEWSAEGTSNPTGRVNPSKVPLRTIINHYQMVTIDDDERPVWRLMEGLSEKTVNEILGDPSELVQGTGYETYQVTYDGKTGKHKWEYTGKHIFGAGKIYPGAKTKEEAKDEKWRRKMRKYLEEDPKQRMRDNEFKRGAKKGTMCGMCGKKLRDGMKKCSKHGRKEGKREEKKEEKKEEKIVMKFPMEIVGMIMRYVGEVKWSIDEKLKWERETGIKLERGKVEVNEEVKKNIRSRSKTMRGELGTVIL